MLLHVASNMSLLSELTVYENGEESDIKVQPDTTSQELNFPVHLQAPNS